jgi:hypothetical protein
MHHVKGIAVQRLSGTDEVAPKSGLGLVIYPSCSYTSAAGWAVADSSFARDCGGRGDQDGGASCSIGSSFLAASALCLAVCSCSDSGSAFVPGVVGRIVEI